MGVKPHSHALEQHVNGDRYHEGNTLVEPAYFTLNGELQLVEVIAFGRETESSEMQRRLVYSIAGAVATTFS